MVRRGGAATGPALQDQYLTLLVAQLQNQDPMEPVSQEEFINQVTQVSMLTSIEELNLSFSQLVEVQNEMLQMQELTLGSDMAGRSVRFRESNGAEGQGTVDRVAIVDGHVQLQVGEKSIAVDQIISVV